MPKLKDTFMAHDLVEPALRVSKAGKLSERQIARVLPGPDLMSLSIPTSALDGYYTVNFYVEHPDFAQDCSCPAYANYMNACKHMLAAEQIIAQYREQERTNRLEASWYSENPERDELESEYNARFDSVRERYADSL